MANSEHIQGYKENGEVGEPITVEQLSAGALHGVSHVWIWRHSGTDIDILLQKRNGRTWPGYWDVSTAGHIDAGERPLKTASREAGEEIGIEINEEQLSLVGIYRWLQEAVTHEGVGKVIENEFQWVYTLLADNLDDAQLRYEESEVDSIRWTTREEFVDLINGQSELGKIIDHDQEYYSALLRHVIMQSHLTEPEDV